MAHVSAAVETGLGVYCRHRPEETLLYQIIEHYYPLFAALRARQGRALPKFVQHEFEDYLTRRARTRFPQGSMQRVLCREAGCV